MATQRERVPWTPGEEATLGDWLHQHAHLSWVGKAQRYPKRRSPYSLQSKFRALRQGRQRRSRIRTRDHSYRMSPRQSRERYPRNCTSRSQGVFSGCHDPKPSVIHQKALGNSTEGLSFRPRSTSLVGLDFNRPTENEAAHEEASPEFSSLERMLLELETLYPNPLRPPVRPAAMIPIGQTIISLPLRLLA
jgi:hypothetical protein